ncbi:uncharacterized protein LOC142711562, partial [Rhinoderma darwinii]|uniref:uncharacterized protein LOC142711562 n=1 Tax=Rhinoderma darwinii TaxID=43563 RepID=UPI003F6778BC
TSVLAAGFVPNSALLQFLWPMKLGDDLRPLKRRNQQQSKCIRAVESSERILQVKKEKINNETEDTTGEIPDETDDRDKIPSLLQDIITAVTAKQVSAPAPETSSAPPQSPAQIHTQKTSESRIPRLHPIQAKKPAVSVHLPPPPPPLSLLPDILDKPWATPSATCKEEELPMESTGSAEVPEIPAFILQFQEQSWFSVVVPGVEAQYSEFESRLLSAFLQAEQPMCSHLLCALQTLHQQGHLKNPQRVFHTLREAINRGANLK